MKSSARWRRSWSNVLAIAYREAILLRHDPAVMAMVLAQPIIILILFGFVVTNEPSNVSWAVLDRSGTAVSRQFVEDVHETGYFRIPIRVGSYDEGWRLLRRGDVLAVLVLPEDFRASLERSRPTAQVLLDGSDTLSAARIGGVIAATGRRFGPARRTEPSTPAVTIRPVDVRQRFWFNPTLEERNFFMAGIAGILLTQICLSVMSMGLVQERENGTYEQILAQPTRSLEIVLGKLIPYIALSYGVLLFITVAAGVLFGLWPRGSWLALLAVTLPFVLATLAVGTFVSAISRNSAQSVFISVFFIMPSIILSGVMLPYQLMPDGIREVGGIFPLRWYQIALRRIIERGAGFTEIAVPGLTLVGMFVVLLALVRWRMKPRLD